MRHPLRSGRSRAGFSLVELLLATVITTMVIMGAITFFASFSSEINRPVITFDGQNYSLGPIIKNINDGVAKTDLYDAVDFHQEFLRRTGAADLVAVFGGTAKSAGAPTPPAVLAKTWELQSLSSLAFVAPGQVRTANEFATQALSNLVYESATTTGVADPSNFTVVAIQGVNHVTLIAQVRRVTQQRSGSALTNITYEGRRVVLYEASMVTRDATAASWQGWAYRFWIPLDEDTWTEPVGAEHLWYRYELSTWWNRLEPGGYSLVFPDPYASAVVSEVNGVRPVPRSRFSFFIPVSP